MEQQILDVLQLWRINTTGFTFESLDTEYRLNKRGIPLAGKAVLVNGSKRIEVEFDYQFNTKIIDGYSVRIRE